MLQLYSVRIGLALIGVDLLNKSNNVNADPTHAKNQNSTPTKTNLADSWNPMMSGPHLEFEPIGVHVEHETMHMMHTSTNSARNLSSSTIIGEDQEDDLDVTCSRQSRCGPIAILKRQDKQSLPHNKVNLLPYSSLVTV